MIKILIAIRAKLKRAIFLKTNISYEVRLLHISSRSVFIFFVSSPSVVDGRQSVIKRSSSSSCKTLYLLFLSTWSDFVCSQAAYLLSHLMSAVEQLEPAWADAFLKRSRFLDADFQGDVLGVISSSPPYDLVLSWLMRPLIGLISTSLRTGHPLPQVTPCPLLDRFMRHSQPVSIPQPDHSTITLPRDIGLNVLMNEQYLSVALTLIRTTRTHFLQNLHRRRDDCIPLRGGHRSPHARGEGTCRRDVPHLRLRTSEVTRGFGTVARLLQPSTRAGGMNEDAYYALGYFVHITYLHITFLISPRAHDGAEPPKLTCTALMLV
jgi:hypothetical protein